MEQPGQEQQEQQEPADREIRPGLAGVAASYPITGFFALALGISWLCLAFIVLVRQGILPRGLLPVAVLALLVGKFGPSLAGLVMTRVVHGPEGIQDLRRRLLSWRVGLGYSLFALLVPFLLAGLALGAHGARGEEVPAVTFHLLLLVIPIFLLKTFLGGGLGEELGWRGFALPALLPRLGKVRSSALIGLFWALWHWPALWLGGMAPLQVLGFSVAVTALSFAFTWLHLSTGGSLFWVILFHAAINTPLAVLDRAAPGLTESAGFSYPFYGAVIVVSVGVAAFGMLGAGGRGDS